MILFHDNKIVSFEIFVVENTEKTFFYGNKTKTQYFVVAPFLDSFTIKRFVYVCNKT